MANLEVVIVPDGLSIRIEDVEGWNKEVTWYVPYYNDIMILHYDHL